MKRSAPRRMTKRVFAYEGSCARHSLVETCETQRTLTHGFTVCDLLTPMHSCIDAMHTGSAHCCPLALQPPSPMLYNISSPRSILGQTCSTFTSKMFEIPDKNYTSKLSDFPPLPFHPSRIYIYIYTRTVFSLVA